MKPKDHKIKVPRTTLYDRFFKYVRCENYNDKYDNKEENNVGENDNDNKNKKYDDDDNFCPPWRMVTAGVEEAPTLLIASHRLLLQLNPR